MGSRSELDKCETPQKPRIEVTETEGLARALVLAEELWPGESKPSQVCRLAEVGADSAIEVRTRRKLEIKELQEFNRANIADTFKGVTKADLRKL